MKQLGINIPEQHKVTSRKLTLIRAGLIGASFHLPHHEVFMYPFMDYLYLLFQPGIHEDPIAFLFWKNDKCIHSSFSDLYYVKKYNLQSDHNIKTPESGLRLSKSGDIWLSIHRVNTAALAKLEEKYGHQGPVINISESEREHILPPAYDLMVQVGLVLNNPENNRDTSWLGLSHSVIDQFEKLLIQSVEVDRIPYPWCPEKDLDLAELSYDKDMLPFLDGFRNVLDEVFEDASASQAMQLRNHVPQLGNVFCVVRTVPSGKRRLGAFPYSAGLLLSNKQRSTLKSWCEGGCGGKKVGSCPVDKGSAGDICLNNLEIPLGTLSRSVADVVFCSGIIDFGHQAGDQVWDRTDTGNLDEQRRSRVESCIYPFADIASLYYVPIHVEGLPWLSIFTFSPSENLDDRWLHNYTFYRDVIQRAASRLRLKARQEYLELASQIASQHMNNWSYAPEEICNNVNRSWEILARVFPMPFLRLSHIAHQNASMQSPQTNVKRMIGQWICECYSNPFFGSPQVRWGRSSPDTFLDALVKNLRQKMSERWQVLEETGQSRAKIAHAIDTQLDSLGYAINEVKDPSSRSALEKELHHLKDFADISMAEIDQRRRSKILSAFQSAAVNDFCDIVDKEAKTALAKLSILEIARSQNVQNRAIKLLKGYKRIHVESDISQGSIVSYYPVHLRAVIMELITNAIRRINDLDVKFYATLGTGPTETGAARLCYQLSNSTDKPSDDLEMLCDELSNGTGGHLGIMNIRTFCKLCDYAPPKWIKFDRDGKATDIRAICQIGLLQHKETS